MTSQLSFRRALVGRTTMATKEDGLSAYANGLPNEARARYMQKLNSIKDYKGLPDPYNLKCGWMSDPSIWPDLTFGDIYCYLVDTPSIYSAETMKSFKSLDAYSYVISGHVKEVYYHCIEEDSPVCFISAKVTPSQRMKEKPHDPWVCLRKKEATVQCAHCTCMAGLGEVCSHVAAVLFKVEIGVRLGMTQTSSTSQACKWNKSFRDEMEPMTVDEFQELVGSRSKPVDSIIPSGNNQLPSMNVLKSLKAACPDAAFFSCIPPLDGELQSESVVETKPAFPPLLDSLTDETFAGLPTEDKQQMFDKIWSNYSCSEEQVIMLEKMTRSQSVCPLWYRHRQGRITGTKAHDVLVRRADTLPDVLVRNVMGYSTFDISRKPAVKWGLNNEEKARNLFISTMSSQHTEFEARLTGFLISTADLFLGVSSDGLTKCKCCGKGVIEIKCPYKHRESLVSDAAKSDKGFCLTEDLTLKATHRYFTQVQLQMHVHQVQYCDFVVFTSKELCITRVKYDAVFSQKLVMACREFFMSLVLPEIVTRKLENGIIDAAENDNVATYCICDQQEYGKMIQCDNDECSFQWFHYACVNVRRKPKGKWYCPRCKDN